MEDTGIHFQNVWNACRSDSRPFVVSCVQKEKPSRSKEIEVKSGSGEAILHFKLAKNIVYASVGWNRFVKNCDWPAITCSSVKRVPGIIGIKEIVFLLESVPSTVAEKVCNVWAWELSSRYHFCHPTPAGHLRLHDAQLSSYSSSTINVSKV